MGREIRKIEVKIIIVALLVLANFYFWQAIIRYPWKSGLLTVTFLNVGQGDAILIDDSYGNQILVDGGDGKRILAELKKNIPFFDREIEMVVLTHPDRDHSAGLIKVLEHYKVDNFLFTGLKKESRTYQNLLDLVKGENLKVIFAQKGQKLCLKNQACLFMVYPLKSLRGMLAKKTNDYCIVSRLVLGKFSLLLTGDADKKLENQLLTSGIPLKSTVLKVAHHGSKYSSQASFLKQVKPLISIISVGRNNPYGHPAPETLERLNGTLLFRTDLNGDIRILTNGKTMEVMAEKASYKTQ